MHADISRDTFDPKSHTLRVVREQGAVLLDADANEQTAVLLYRLHALAADLFGPFWGPAGQSEAGDDRAGFKIGEWDEGKKNFPISRGRYYVNGLPCENEDPTSFLDQPPLPGAAFPPGFDFAQPFVVYLDAWEREVNEAEARAKPGAIDPAFQALAPSPRTELVWQVRVAQNDATKVARNITDLSAAKPWVAAAALANIVGAAAGDGRLTARVKSSQTGGHDGDYTGPENQLYRVEIHHGGKPYQPKSNDPTPTPPDQAATATFKWSRDNGSVTIPLNLDDKTTAWEPDATDHTFIVPVLAGGRDDRTRLQKDDRVEYVDPALALSPDAFAGEPIRQLFTVHTVGDDAVTLRAASADPIPLPGLPSGATRWAFLRRWDFRAPAPTWVPRHATGSAPPAADGALLVVAPSESEAPGKPEYLDIEVGIQVRFEAGKTYQPGDYWLIPARTASGDIVWPRTAPAAGKAPDPLPVPARNTRHFFAPLAVVDPSVSPAKVTDLRRQPAANLTRVIPS